MELTGRCKEEFERWLVYNDICEDYQTTEFYKYVPSMQWGVLQDFFDISKIDTDYLFENEIYIQLSKNDGKGSVGDFREIARKYAIERANELYNNAN